MSRTRTLVWTSCTLPPSTGLRGSRDHVQVQDIRSRRARRRVLRALALLRRRYDRAHGPFGARLMADHAQLLGEAIEAERRAHRALLAGDDASEELRAAAALYRSSWEAAPPASYGRLIGMLKAAVLAGDAREEALYARGSLGDAAGSAPASYALAIAALVEGDDAAAAEGMRGGSEAMVRAADAIAALAAGDEEEYGRAVRAIVEDFEGRDEHLTGVPIADTALMLERLAAARGMACGITSPLLPSRP